MPRSELKCQPEANQDPPGQQLTCTHRRLLAASPVQNLTPSHSFRNNPLQPLIDFTPMVKQFSFSSHGLVGEENGERIQGK